MSLPTVSTKNPLAHKCLSGVVAFALQAMSRDVDRALALEVANDAGNRQLRRNAHQHVDMVGQNMPLFDVAFLLLGQTPEHRAKLPAHHSKERSPSVFRNEDNVVFALPFGVTQTAIIFHGSCVGCAALVGSQLTPRGGLLDKSNSESLPGKAGGTPIDH